MIIKLPPTAAPAATTPVAAPPAIITEPQILLDYVRLAFIPDIFSYNPFHDNYPKNTVLFGNFFAVFSIVMWFLFLILFSIILHTLARLFKTCSSSG